VDQHFIVGVPGEFGICVFAVGDAAEATVVESLVAVSMTLAVRMPFPWMSLFLDIGIDVRDLGVLEP
jgi:hypothetical protein